MKHLNAALLGLALILFSSSLFAQDHECGTVLSQEDLAHHRSFNQSWQQNTQTRSGTSIIMVPVQLHILRQTDGSLGISVAEFEAALDRANELFLPSGLQFYQCAAINTIDDDTYSPYDYSQMAALDAAHSVTNVINIYSSESVTSGTSNICGHAQFPGGLDFVMLANSCTNNGSTFAHELGHYFLLYHTHQGSNELVDGTNCGSAGDFLCDTPADPRLSTASNVDATSCVYTGTATDANGDSYSPETDNFMSYTGKHCRLEVSADQHTRMLAAYNAYRTYLTCGSAVALDADFAADTEVDCSNNLVVQFCDVSEGAPTGWSWTFGDGAVSTSQHPSHTYTAAGTYDVSLTVSLGAASDVQTYTAKIKVGTVGIPYTQDFESAAALNQWKITTTMKGGVSLSASAANGGTGGLMMDGASVWASPYYYIPTASANAFNELQNPYYKSLAELCVNADDYENLNLSFDLRQMYFNNAGYTNFRVTVNGVQIGSTYQANTSENWATINIDLSAYDQSSFTLGLESSTVYDNAGGSANYIDNISLTGDQVLPVEYASFEVAQNGPDVWLDWATLSESNNERFEVQRSTDQVSWEPVGSILAHSGNAAIKTYQFRDYQAASLASNKLYYQLKQIDYNGASDLSEVKSLKLNAISQMLVFPNPSNGQFSIVLPQPEAEQVKIKLSDLQGREVYANNTASNNQAANLLYELNLSHLNRGIYLLQVNMAGLSYVKKIVIE